MNNVRQARVWEDAILFVMNAENRPACDSTHGKHQDIEFQDLQTCTIHTLRMAEREESGNFLGDIFNALKLVSIVQLITFPANDSRRYLA